MINGLSISQWAPKRVPRAVPKTAYRSHFGLQKGDGAPYRAEPIVDLHKIKLNFIFSIYDLLKARIDRT